MYNILTPGQKIKEIRKQIGLNQQDIVGGQITRNMISMIENDKSRLTPSVAKIVAENINRICTTKSISYFVDENYLLEDIESQIKRIANEFILYLESHEVKNDNDLNDKIKEIDKLFMEYSSTTTEFLVYFKIGRFFGDRKDYLNSYIYYIKALENNTHSLESMDRVRLLSDLGYTCLRLNRYKEALKYINLALYYLKSTTDRLYYILHFNAALAYKKDFQYDNSLSELTIIESTYKQLDNKDKFDIYSLQANCFNILKRHNDALKIYNTLISMVDKEDVEKRLFVLSNMLDVYALLNDTRGIVKVIDKSAQLLEKYKVLDNTLYTCQIYNEYGNAFLKLGNYNKALEFYQCSMLSARKSKNTAIISISINRIIDIYINDNNLEQVDYVKNLVIEYIASGLISLDDGIIYKIIKFYNDNNDKVSVSSIVEFILSNKSR